MTTFCLWRWKRLQLGRVVQLLKPKQASVMFTVAPSARHSLNIIQSVASTRCYTAVGVVEGLYGGRKSNSTIWRFLSSQTTDSKSTVLETDPLHELNVSEMITAAAEDILKEPNIARYGDLGSKSKKDFIVCLQSFVSNGFPCRILGTLAECPQVLQNPQRLLDLLETLNDLALSEKDIVKMIENDVNVLKLRREVFKEAFYKLLSVGFSSDTVLKMFVEQPKLITADLSGAEKRIEELKILFSNEDTFKLMKENPRLLFSNLEEIKKKFNYVYHEMGIEQPKMMRVKVFSHTLEHIHVRHMFLVKTGFYRIIKEKDRLNKNPTLDVILNSSDADFAKKFGDMTADDYSCFKELMLEEQMLDGVDGDIKRQKQSVSSFSDTESDSDSDSDDD